MIIISVEVQICYCLTAAEVRRFYISHFPFAVFVTETHTLDAIHHRNEFVKKRFPFIVRPSLAFLLCWCKFEAHERIINRRMSHSVNLECIPDIVRHDTECFLKLQVHELGCKERALSRFFAYSVIAAPCDMLFPLAIIVVMVFEVCVAKECMKVVNDHVKFLFP